MWETALIEVTDKVEEGLLLDSLLVTVTVDAVVEIKVSSLLIDVVVGEIMDDAVVIK